MARGRIIRKIGGKNSNALRYAKKLGKSLNTLRKFGDKVKSSEIGKFGYTLLTDEFPELKKFVQYADQGERTAQVFLSKAGAAGRDISDDDKKAYNKSKQYAKNVINNKVKQHQYSGKNISKFAPKRK